MKPKKKRAALPSTKVVGAAAASPVPATPALTVRRKWLLRLVAMVGVSSLVFGLLELTLHLCGYGYPTSFFVKSPVAGQTTMMENRRFSRRYFAPELVRIPQSLAFCPVKPPQTLRVFVFGESAAEGDPGPAFGFARILQVLLRERYPGQNVEVINTAVTAINSHVIRPIAHESAGYSGDVWVVYMGNNEVVGPFGSGTVFGTQAPGLQLIRANLALKATETGQLLDELIHGLGRKGAPHEWQGMEMFLNQQVRQDDPRMATVYSHFQRNLTDIIAAGIRSGAKVVVSTVGSNLRDCAPLASLHRADFSAAKTAEWDGLYRAGVVLEKEGKHADAIVKYKAALQLDDQFADLQFRLGRCRAASGQKDEARHHFTLARDLDTLRFRADSHINDIIRQTAGEWQSRGVRLADFDAALARESADGIPGGEWFYEHVHLTFAGNYLVARQLADLVVQSVPATAGAGDGAKPFLSAEECARRLGLTEEDRLRMTEEMQRRTSRPPFTHQLDHAEDAARREKAVAELRQQATNFQAAAAIYEQALARNADDWRLHDNFAGILLNHGDTTKAVEHWRRVAQLLPHRTQTYDLMGSILIEQGKLDEAEGCYRQALRIQPNFAEGIIGLGRVQLGQKHGEEAIGEFRQAAKLLPRSASPLNHLGLALLQLGKNAEAEAAFRDALRVEPDFTPGRMNLNSALLAQGKTDQAMADYEELIRANPGDKAVRLALGKALAKQGKTEEALLQYSEAVRQHPDDFDARYACANALLRLNRTAEAEEHFAAAIRIRPDSFESRLNYGSILAGQKKTAEARAQFEEALKIKPDFAPAHLNVAVALIEQGRWSDAITHLREVLRIEPGNVRAKGLLETALVRQKAAP